MKTLRIRISPMFIISVLIFFGFIGLGMYTRSQENNLGDEITISEFEANLKNNKYAVMDIRDDRKAVGLSKFIFQVEGTVDISDLENADTVKEGEFKEISFDEFSTLIKPPTFNDVINAFKGDDSKDVTEIVVGNDFIIGKRLKKNGEDYLVREIDEEKFRSGLNEKGLNISNLSAKVYFLKSASKDSSVEEIKSVFRNGGISDVWILEGNTYALLNTKNFSREYVNTNFTEDFARFLQDEGISFDSINVQINSVQTTKIPWGDIVSLISLLGLVLIAFFLIRGIQGSGSKLSQFGESRARMFFGRKPEVTFEDVAGVDEAKEELNEIVMFLKHPAKFLKMGARIPKGVLMVGSPGTGKTLLARAIAGEAGVPFFHTSGAEFEEMLVGAGASRVRDLFAKAKKAAPALIFIDEIDALARKRGTTIQSSTTEQTLNQILVEMDGFEKNTEVIVIAATNRPDVLDPAILRPGRFDRRIVLDLPDIEGRKQILKIHSENKPLAKDVDLERVAKRTVGFSGADLENMLNEAAIITAKANRQEVNSHDIEEAATKVSLGPEKKRKRTEEELKMTAYHEAGHALVAKYTPKSDPVHRITIISRGLSLGSTMQLPQEDKLQQTEEEMMSRLKVLMGGRAAEEIIYKDVTSGASNDIEKATSIARNMIKRFGMSKKLGLVKYGESNELQYLGYGYGEQRDYSEETANQIDAEVKRIINEAYSEAKAIIIKHKAKLNKLVKFLLEREVIESEEFEALIK